MGGGKSDTTRLQLNSSAASGASLVTSSTGTSETPRSRSPIFCYVVSLFPPPSFCTAPLHLALHLEDPLGLVGKLRPGSGVRPHRRLSTTGNGRVCLFIFEP